MVLGVKTAAMGTGRYIRKQKRKGEAIQGFIKLAFFLGAIFWVSQSDIFLSEPPSFKDECLKYLQEYRAPVAFEQVQAFVRGKEEDNSQAKAVFLMPSRILLFNGAARGGTWDPKMVEIPFSNIKRVRIKKFGFWGVKMEVVGESIDERSSISLEIPNRKYGDFFVEKFESLRGVRRS